MSVNGGITLLLIYLVGGLGFALLLNLVFRACDIENVKTTISFDSFKSFYQVNPERWELGDYTVACNKPSSYSYITRQIWFKFNYIDSFRYRWFKRNIKRNNQNAQATKNYNDMINIVKADIAAFEKKNKEETERMLNEIWNDRVK